MSDPIEKIWQKGAGKEKKARAQAAKVLELKPDLTVDWVKKALNMPESPEHLRYLDNLRKAGLP